MNFSYRDMTILLSMSLMVILMTFTFTALGIGSGSVDDNNIPEFNESASEFDIVGDFPENPGQPSQFEMKFNSELEGDSDNQVWLDGDTDSGREVILTNSSGNPRIAFNNWTSGTATQEEHTFSQIGEQYVFDNFSYEFLATYDRIENENESDETMVVIIEIREQPESGAGWLKRIPVIGGVYSTGETVAGVIAWIGSIFYWFFGVTLEVIISLSLMLYNAMAFFVNFSIWLLTSYTGIVTSSSAWVSVFLAIPGILIMFEFAKLIMIGIKLLPTT